jgi:predicted CopG family antitoxin
MASKSISITEDVYNLLDKFRLKHESFSQAILRLLKKQANLLELAGAWSKISDIEPALEMIEKVVDQVHNSSFGDKNPI